MPRHNAYSLLVLAMAVVVALCSAPAAAAAASGIPVTGTVTALRAYRVPASGAIVTDVTIATADGSLTFALEGGVVQGLGMLTSEFVELRLADHVAVLIEETAPGVYEATDAPVRLLGSGGMRALAATDYIYDGHRWDGGDLPLSWRFNSSNAPAGALTAVQAAADTWESDPGSAIDFTYAGTSGATPGTADDINTVGWRQNVSGGQLATCVIWFYETRATLGYNRIVEFDIDFNRAYSWSTSGAGGSYDIQSVALHEFGHSLHLGDLHDATPTSAQEVMNGYIAAGDWQRSLGAGDRAGANAIYPDGDGSTPPPPPPPPPPPSDVTPPASTGLVTPESWTRGTAIFSMSASDGGSGVTAMNYRIGDGAAQSYAGPVSLDIEGVTTVTYWSVDAAGNAEAPKTARARIDRTPPALSSDAGSGYVGEAVVRVGASDGLSGVASISYRVDGGQTIAAPGSSAVITIANPGAHSIEVVATDGVGNTASSVSEVRIAPRDAEAPVTTASGVPSGWTSSTASVSLSAAENDIATTYYRVGDGPAVPYSIPIDVGAEGETRLAYWSADKTGNVEAPRTAIIRIDRTPPAVTCVPAPVYRTVAEIRIDGSDAHSGVEHVSWRLDGGDWRLDTGTSASIVTTTPGTHVLDYLAVDGAGNMREGTTTFAVLTPAGVAGRPSATTVLARRRGVAALTLSATVRRADGRRIPRAAVMLQRSTNGRTWTTVARATANASGSVSRRMTFKRAGVTYWRWRIGTDGALGHEAAVSRPVKVRVR